MKAINKTNFNHLIPPTFSLSSGHLKQKFNKLSTIQQKMDYNPIITESQEKN